MPMREVTTERYFCDIEGCEANREYKNDFTECIGCGSWICGMHCVVWHWRGYGYTLCEVCLKKLRKDWDKRQEAKLLKNNTAGKECQEGTP